MQKFMDGEFYFHASDITSLMAVSIWLCDHTSKCINLVDGHILEVFDITHRPLKT